MELIGYLIFNPVFLFFQGLVGILTPTECPHLIRLQRVAAVFLVIGVVTMATAFGLISFSVNGWGCFSTFAAGFVLLVIAGSIGHYIETKAKN